MNLDSPIRHYKKILFIAAVIYTFFYLSSSMLPGNNLQAPIGWWGWFDQGQYLLEAKSLCNFNFNSFYFYPPLYAIFGSIFYKFMPNHPFYFVNLLSFLVYIYFFIKLTQKQVGLFFAIVSILIGLFYDNRIFEQFIIPWTTTPAAAIIAMSLYILFYIKEQQDIGLKSFIKLQIAFVFFTGLLIALRPIDAFILCITIYPFYIFEIVKKWKNSFYEQISFKKILFINILFGLIGFAIFLSFNFLTTGSIFGNYASLANSNGFSFFRIFEKFTDLFVDSYSIYYIKNSSLFYVLPWLYLSFASMLYLLFLRKFKLRFLIIFIFAYIGIYICYNDFVINGLWMYSNIHYFKWFFPYLVFLIFVAFKNAICSEKKLSLILFFSIASILTFLLHYHYEIEYIKKSTLKDINSSSKLLILSSKEKIDGIDIYTDINQSFVDMYFGKHTINYNNTSIAAIKDFRIVPTDFGMRVILYRPIQSDQIQLNLTEQILLDSRVKFKPFSFAYSLDFPNGKNQLLYSDYNFGDKINLSSSESQRYIVSGFSGSEAFGRWTDGGVAKIAFMADKIESNMCLNVSMGAFLNSNSKQKVDVSINNNLVSQLDFTPSNAGFGMYSINIPDKYISDEKILIKFDIKYPTSPLDLKLNSDKRKLGVSIGEIELSMCK